MLLRTRLEYLRTKSAIAVNELHGQLAPPLSTSGGTCARDSNEAGVSSENETAADTLSVGRCKTRTRKEICDTGLLTSVPMRATNSGLKH